MLAYDFAANFPNLRVLELGDAASFEKPCVSNHFPNSLQLLRYEALLSDEKLLELIEAIPRNITSLFLKQRPNSFGLAPRLLSEFPLRELSIHKIYTPGPTLGLPVLESLDVRVFDIEHIIFLPSMLRTLKIGALKTPASYERSQWVYLVSSLPRSLKVLQLPILGNDFLSANPTNLPVPISAYPKDLIETMFPPGLESIRLHFTTPPFEAPNGLAEQSSSSYCVKFPDSLKSFAITGLHHTNALTFRSSPLISPLHLPSVLTRLKLPSTTLFCEDYWKSLPNLVSLKIGPFGAVTEEVLFSDWVPKSLTSVKMNSVLLSGLSWIILQQAVDPVKRLNIPTARTRSSLPVQSHNTPEAIHNFLNSFSHCSKRSFLEAFHRAVALRYPYGTLQIRPSYFRLSSVLALPPAILTASWHQIRLRLDSEFESLSHLPSRLQFINLHANSIPYAKLDVIPATIKRAIGATVQFCNVEDMNDLARQYFGTFRSINFLGSFSCALRLRFPSLENCKVTVNFQLEAAQIFEWIPLKTEKLRLANFENAPLFTSDALLAQVARFSSLQKLECDWIYRNTDGLCIDLPNLRTMTVRLESNLLSTLPKSLTHLRLDYIRIASLPQYSDWPPNLTHLELHGHTQTCVQSFAPTILPNLQTFILESERLVNKDISLFPRSLKSLRIKGYGHKLSSACIRLLPPSLTYFKVCGAEPDRNQVMDFLQGRS
jgi:hypothetical protein